MRKSFEILVTFIVILALVGFVVLSVFVMYKTCKITGNVKINDNYTVLANILTGLIGGVVALGFGISPPRSEKVKESLVKRNMIGLGGLVTVSNLFTGSNKSKSRVDIKENNNLQAKEILGFIYALSYIIISCAAVVIWASDDTPHEIVKNLATIFIGMIPPIVVGYFK
ncbi:MAG: hypothetical protein NTY95_13275 [Bacteroidia bacterium]|jgi:DMSO reductase anchor subunit|nr:hypothetical protein [Bacteroidia bacterium]